MILTYTNKAGQRYQYYACATARRSKPRGCAQRQVAAVDLEVSIHRQLEPVLEYQLSRPLIQNSVERIWYQATRVPSGSTCGMGRGRSTRYRNRFGEAFGGRRRRPGRFAD